VLLYGAEPWRTTKAMVSKIQRCINYCLRKIFQFWLCVSTPGVSRSSSASFALWVPFEGLSGNAVCWFPQCVANPCPFPLLWLVTKCRWREFVNGLCSA
jgi:hypothetical protein